MAVRNRKKPREQRELNRVGLLRCSGESPDESSYGNQDKGSRPNPNAPAQGRLHVPRQKDQQQRHDRERNLKASRLFVGCQYDRRESEKKKCRGGEDQNPLPGGISDQIDPEPDTQQVLDDGGQGVPSDKRCSDRGAG